MGLLKFFGIFLICMFALWTVVAEPAGPSNIDIKGSSRYPSNNAANISAVAGNLTEINFQANTATNTWQGYFGNISGSIKLGDANNNTLYDWTSASPNGEIYATRSASTPTWSSVSCASSGQVDSEDSVLGVNQALDSDSVNRTFLNTTSFNAFFVGNVNINSTQNCYATNLYNNSAAPSTDFQEVLLHDGSSMIYTALIKQDATGFDSRTHDFEMLVGENGHNGDTNPTPYYFYIELG